MLLGGGLTLISAVIRFISVFLPIEHYESYIILFVGTCFAAMAQPLLLNAAAQLAGNWFKANERDIVTTVATMFSPLGNALGVSISPSLVTLSGSGEVKGMEMYFLYQLIFAAVPFIWAVFCFKSYPPTPPSRSTEERQQLHALTKASTSWRHCLLEVWREMKTLFHNRDYLVVLWCFGLGLAFFNALLTVLSQLVEPCGYSEDEAGNLGAIFLGCGLIGALIMGLLMDATHWYRPILKAGYLLAFAGVLFFLWAQRPDQFLMMAICLGVLGAVMLPLLPASIENCVECTFPTPEIYSSGLLLAAGNTVGIGVTFGLTMLIEKDYGHCGSLWKPSNIFTLVLVGLAAFPILLYHGQYLRLKMGAQSTVLYGVDAPGTALPLMGDSRTESRSYSYQGVEGGGRVSLASSGSSMEASV